MSSTALPTAYAFTDAQLRAQRPPRLDTADADALRRAVHAYFHATFTLYERLFDLLADDAAFLQRPEPLRHPLIFYYGHTACFFINKLNLVGAVSRINERIESDLAIGVDEMSWDDLGESDRAWPTAAEVRAYRGQVRAAIDELIRTAPLVAPVTWDNHVWWGIVMGIEHERIHLETSTVLLRQLALSHLRADAAASPLWAACDDVARAAPANALVPVPGGDVHIERAHGAAALYGWDNEFGSHSAAVEAFQASKFLVSNAEFAEFVRAGGYTTAKWWGTEGWEWVQFRRITHPTFWVRTDGAARDAPVTPDTGFRYRVLVAEIDMPWSWPVDVNCLEARAFCTWMQYAKRGNPSDSFVRLPSEDEYLRLLEHSRVPDVTAWGAVAPGNINLEAYASSCPVDKFAQGDLYDVTGNVWQWTETFFHQYDGFKVHPLYDDFSVPCFDGQHNMIKGGSWASTGNEAGFAARYAFRPHFYQHAGFRYVVVPAAAKNVPQFVAFYDTDKAVSEYLEFHWGDEYFSVPNFPAAVGRLAVAKARELGVHNGSAFDIGCAVGRTAFELATHFERVVGADFSARFVKECWNMLTKRRVTYRIPIEGEVCEEHTRAVPYDAATVCPRLSFQQADACNLHARLTGFDLVVAANLIDRLYDPRLFTNEIPHRVNVGGLLVVTSPYTWLEQYTPRTRWLGGFYDEHDRPVSTFDGLARALAPHFVSAGEPVDVPMVIRETKRKHQHTVVQMSFWRRVQA